MSAYGLIYIPESQVMELKTTNLFETYSSYISQNIKDKIERQVKRTKADFIRKANENKVDEIIKLDYSRYSLINKWMKNNKARLETYMEPVIS